MTQSNLVNEAKEKKKEYRTDFYSMSIGEIINLYKEEELIINPDFQRFFRWSNRQKTSLIESILLGIPIPSIFVYQTDEGKWELVDGLQRVSTILEFAGVLKDENGALKPELILSRTKILPSLKDITWNTLDKSLELEIKRAKFKVEIIKNESDPDAKFEVFMRLNTGGSNLSAQELRNTWLVMYNKDFYIWLEKLSKNNDFQECIAQSEESLLKRYDIELLLCYLIYPDYHKDFTTKEKEDLLTDALKDLADEARNSNFDYKTKKQIFEKTFKLLNESLSDDVFRKYDKGTNRFRGKFLESLFEVISIGVSNAIDKYNSKGSKEELIKKIKNLWDTPQFTENMGSGTNTKTRVPKIVPLGIQYFNE